MKENKKILAIIPACGGSKGIPRKNTSSLAGKPLIAYSIEAALKSKYIDKVVVSTDDEEIAEVAKRYNAEMIKRLEKLAKAGSSTIDTIFHTINVLKAKSYDSHAALLLQLISPLRISEDINNALRNHLEIYAYSMENISKIAHWYPIKTNKVKT